MASANEPEEANGDIKDEDERWVDARQDQQEDISNGEPDLVLHEAVFRNQTDKVEELIADSVLIKSIINLKDKHGNTPLHLACMLGRSKEIVSALLQSGASVDCKNLNRWTPFHEACSYGDREIIAIMTKRLNDDLRVAFENGSMQENLGKTRNYRLVLKWEFQSWVPLISRVLPSDVCVIYKQGRYIRIDTSLLDFEIFNQKRARSCLIYSEKFKNKWVVVNHAAKQYRLLDHQGVTDIETRVDEFMSIDIMDMEMKLEEIQLTRSTSGWIWKADKMEKIGKFNAALYNFNNAYLITRKRREHLKEEDLKRNKGVSNFLKFGKKPSSRDLEDADPIEENSDDKFDGFEDTEDIEHRESLTPPPPTTVTWDQYISSDAGQFPNLGREHKSKVVKTAFKAKIAMSDEFPITTKEFLDLLSIVPLKLFKKLKDFIELRLPDGFPVRLDVPIFPILTARITFEDFNFIDGPVDESLFSVPSDYVENPELAPLFNGRDMKGRSSGSETGGSSS